MKRYRDKRDFRRTPEPRSGGGRPERLDDENHPIFVMQEHRARSHHFDFRLEAGGALKSWAVPKGPSVDPSDKRLAREVEDHPLDYADFEGTIPKDQYGGGSVIVWDAGPYRPLRTGDDGEPIPVERQIADGQVEVWLEGRKIRGGYALVQAKIGGDDRNWLLVKMKDEGADARRNPVRTERESVISGRTVDEIADTDGNS